MKSRGKFFWAGFLCLSCTICGVTAGMPAFARHDKATAEPADENMKQGMAAIRKRDYETAVDNFKQAVYFSRNHYNPEAYKFLGLCYKANRQYTLAIEALLHHLEQTTGKSPDAHLDLAECYMNLGDYEKARSEIDKGYIDEEGQGTYRQSYTMGELAEKMGDLGDAAGYYSAAIEGKPHYTEAWMGRGRIEVKLKNMNDAIRTYRHILDEGPLMAHVDYHELYYNMATCFLSHGDHQNALDHLRMALQYNPDSYDAHLALARIFDDEKHIASAVTEYEAAIRCAPKDHDTMQINKRILYLQESVKPKEVMPEIKPSPTMRQEIEKRKELEFGKPQAPKGDPGF